MNTLKAIQYGFPLTKPTHIQRDKANSRRRSTICFSTSDGSESSTSFPDGDKRKQELLAQIAMLQAQKVRLTDFLDKRSSNLTQFAEVADAEFDAIGENALKELDDAGTRIMEKLESRMQAFEETAELNRQEMESNEKVLEEFQEQIVRDKNEGLFFKNLGQKTSRKEAEAMEDAQKLRQQAKETASTRTRRNVYLALMLLLILAVGNAVFAGPEVDWRKVGALLLILFGLLAQFIYEQSLSTETDETKKEK
ncbi:uncharacterized protein LOC110022060 [Phalaenopsis equestris]|uniref:uncharacterized protein LOC110022060 n=1 Tax=Phalaenopsis equestris TaxID=78828 RepID=UPI0009E630B5|nr:uncharacterized protein LOC110022060 [Phalaenopsis equestris]